MKKIVNELDKYVENTLFYQDLPGLVVLVNGRDFRYKKAAGYKNFVTKEPLQAEQIFHMASVSKLFTSSAIIQLCEKGKLALTDRPVDILTEVAIGDKRYKDIEIHHMLTHTSGLGDVSDYRWDQPRLDDQALRDYAISDEVAQSKLLWSPGTDRFRYSNMAYELLGLIVAEVSGLTFEEYIEENIFRPLGMHDSTFLTAQRTGGSLKLTDLSQADMAMPHTKDAEKHIVLAEHYPYNREHAPSSTLTSNVDDLAKWGRAHLEKSFFSPNQYQKIWKKYATVTGNGEGMGLGWFIREQEGLLLYGHEGNDDGFRSSFWICPAAGIQIIVCSNLTKAPVKKVSKSIFEMIIRSEYNQENH